MFWRFIFLPIDHQIRGCVHLARACLHVSDVCIRKSGLLRSLVPPQINQIAAISSLILGIPTTISGDCGHIIVIILILCSLQLPTQPAVIGCITLALAKVWVKSMSKTACIIHPRRVWHRQNQRTHDLIQRLFLDMPFLRPCIPCSQQHNRLRLGNNLPHHILHRLRLDLRIRKILRNVIHILDRLLLPIWARPLQLRRPLHPQHPPKSSRQRKIILLTAHHRLTWHVSIHRISDLLIFLFQPLDDPALDQVLPRRPAQRHRRIPKLAPRHRIPLPLHHMDQIALRLPNHMMSLMPPIEIRSAWTRQR